MASKGGTKLLVASIDFGTTFSGWAFLFKHQYESDPTKVFAKNWNNGTNISSKTPTTILIQPDGKTLEAFGYEAEDRYAELAAENKHHAYFYFRRFKMTLYDKINLKRDVVLDEENGKQLPAITVFSLAIRCIREDLLEECRQQIGDGNVDDKDIHWVLTVPAIWNDSAKQFMRESAKKAGIASDRLTIALEPEAASLFCKHLAIHRTDNKTGISLDAFSTGSKYIVLDAGGGTIDITVHEVLEDGGLRELHRASGGAWGGTKVDEQFNQLFIKIFGAPIMVKFRKRHMDDYIDIFRNFEVKKREVSLGKEKPFQIRLPTSLVELFKDETDKELKETINQMAFKGNVSLSPGNKLKVDASVMKDLFADAIDNTVKHLIKLLHEPVVRNVKCLLMVGGFSESAVLQETVRAQFPKIKVIVAPEASLVVVKGAAIFGHREEVVKERISRYTYGFSATVPFEEGFHPEELAVYANGEKQCRGSFVKLVEIGESLGINERRQDPDNLYPPSDSLIMKVPVYASTQKNPKTVHEDGNEHLGDLDVDISNRSGSRIDEAFRFSGIFGQTEIKMEVLEVRTGKYTAGVFDSL